MPLEGVVQPDVILLKDGLRLARYDGDHACALAGYRDPYVYQNSEGIFDETKIPDMEYIARMFGYLDEVGELYFIEADEGGVWRRIGDITVKPENPPVAIWFETYRGKGVGTLAMRAAIDRLRALGYPKITGSTVYKWNEHSLNMHKRLGFRIVSEDDREYTLEMDLV